MNDFRCKQCEVWTGEPLIFQTIEEAEEHAMRLHPNRLLQAYQEAVKGTFARVGRLMALGVMLRDRCEDEKL